MMDGWMDMDVPGNILNGLSIDNSVIIRGSAIIDLVRYKDG